MKKIRLTVLMLALGLSGAYAQKDVFGYTFKTDTNAGGPAKEFIDISNRPGVVNLTGLADDNGTALNPIGFAFHYYYDDYDKVALGVNGWISFNKGTVLSPTFPIIPTAGGKANNYIAAYMSDLNFASSDPNITNPGKLQYWTNNKDTFIASYIDVPFWQQAKPGFFGKNTFQIILCGKDSSITLNYGKLDPTGNSSSSAPYLQAGIENVSGQSGLRAFVDKVPTVKTIKYYYPKVITSPDVKDVATQWNQNDDNGSFFALKDDSITLKANVANVGNVAVTNVKMTATIQKGTKITNFKLTNPILTLAAANDSTVALTPTFKPDAGGAYVYTVTSTCDADGFSGNNKNASEIIVIDTAKQTKVSLNYVSDMNTPGTPFGLQGDSTAAAVYIVPPYYPATIGEVEAMLIDQANAQGAGDLLPGGFRAVIYDDNGVAKGPGTKLAVINVPTEETANLSVNTAKLATPIEITEGGFYIAIFTDSANVSPSAETKVPFSFRTFEIIAGACSPYRQGDVQDFQIGAVMYRKQTTIGVNNQVSDKGTVSQSFPNPTNGLATIKYSLTEAAKVDFTVTNMIGQVVEQVSAGTIAQGNHNVQLNTADYNAGIYFYTMYVDGLPVATHKMVVSK